MGAPVVVFTDALLMTGAMDPRGEVSAARRALLAGCDALVLPTDPERLAAEIRAESGFEAEAQRAAERLDSLVATLEDLPAMPPLDDGGLDGVPLRVADRALRLVGGHAPEAESPGGLFCLVDDDGVPDRGRLLLQPAKASGVGPSVARPGKGPR